MSNKRRKNFHYHYAEKYETRQERSARRRARGRFVAPPLTLVVSLVMLLLFGLITTSFSVYVTNNRDESMLDETGKLNITMRSKPVREDADSYGVAQYDEAQSEDVAELEEAEPDSPVNAKEDTSLVSVGADVDHAATGTARTGYYVTGNTSIVSDGWGNFHQMTVSSGGYYCYLQTESLTATNNGVNSDKNEFVVTDGAAYTTKYKNLSTTELKHSGNWTSAFWKNDENNGNGNFALWTSTAKQVYIVTYFPDTELNNNTYPVTYIYDSLPDDTVKYKMWNNFATGIKDGDSNYTSTELGTTSGANYNQTFTGTFTLPKASHDYYFKIYKDFSSSSYSNDNSGKIQYWFGNSNSITTSISDRNCDTNVSGNIKITSVAAIKGTYSYSFTDSDWHDNSSYERITLSITYPSYHTVSRSATPTNGNLFIGDEDHSNPTGTSSVNVCEGHTYYAKMVADTNYELDTLTVGGVDKTSIAVQQSAPNDNVWLYTGTMGNANVSIKATFKVKQVPHFHIGADAPFPAEMDKTVNDVTGFTYTAAVDYAANAAGTLSATATAEGGGVEVVSATCSNGAVTVTMRVKSKGVSDPDTISDIIGDTEITVKLIDTPSVGEAIERDSGTLTVTVDAPTITITPVSIEEKRTGTLASSSPTPAPTSYSWATSASNISLQGATTGTSVSVLAGDYSTTGSHTSTVSLTATYASGYTKQFDSSVTVARSKHFLHVYDNDSIGTDFLTGDKTMTYDATATNEYKNKTDVNNHDLYSIAWLLPAGKTIKFTYFNSDASTTHYKGANFTSSSDTIDVDGKGVSLVQANNDGGCTLTTQYRGWYYLYLRPDTKTLFVKSYPQLEYYLQGLNEGWELRDDQKMTVDPSNSNIYTKTHTFTAGEHFETGSGAEHEDGFKIYTNDGDVYYGYNGTFTQKDNSQTLDTSGSAPNAGFYATYSGTYTFTLNKQTKVLTITYPDRHVTASATYPSGSGTATATLELDTTDADFKTTYDATSGKFKVDNTFMTLVDNGDDTYTVTHKNPAEYEFEEWSDTTTGSSVTLNATSSTTQSIGSTWEYQGYTVTLHNSNCGTIYYNGDHSETFTPDVSGTIYTGMYKHNTGLTLPTADDFSGGTYNFYVFDGWIDDATNQVVTSIPGSATQDKSFTARWKINIEFKDNIRKQQIATQYVTVGGTVNTSDSTFTSYISDADTALAEIGFTPNTTSEYSVANLSRQTIDGAWVSSRADRAVIYRQYLPAAHQFNVSFTPNGRVGTQNGTAVNAGKATNPYVINFGSQIAVKAEVVTPENVDATSTIYQSITYKWQASLKDATGAVIEVVDQQYTAGTSNKVFERSDITTLMTKNTAANYYSLSAKACYTLDGIEIESEALATFDLYYKIPKPLSSVSYTRQKIYNTIPDITVNLTTDQSLGENNDASGDKARFTSNDSVWMKLYNAVTNSYQNHLPSFVSPVANSSTDYTATFTSNVSLSGVLYTKYELWRPTNVKNPVAGQTEMDSELDGEELVVGAKDGYTNRPLYVKNSTETPLSGYRVMLFYIATDGSLMYQTAINLNSTGAELYRFDVPDSASVCIAAFDKTEKYVLPIYDDENEELVWSDGSFETNCKYYSDFHSVTGVQALSITPSEGNITITDTTL